MSPRSISHLSPALARLAMMSAAAAALLGAGAAQASTTLLSEDFSGVAAGLYSGAITGSVFSTYGANVDVITPATFSCVNNPGGACVDIVGNQGAGGIQSNAVFNLTAGSTYAIDFNAILQGYAPTDLNTTTFTVGLGSFLQTIVLGPNAQSFAFNYTASGNETGSLIFSTTIPADSVHGAVIDHISLTETAAVVPTDGVPEPASWALMIAGFGLAGASLRRRRPVATA